MNRSRLRLPLTAAALGLAAITLLASCGRNTDDQLVVYTALDADFSLPILKAFEKTNNFPVVAKTDTESIKTVGFVNNIIAEQGNPRCNVFWNNEILHTIRLKKMGLLDSYHSPNAKNYPAAFRSSDGTWHGLAARARVIIVNTDLVPKDQWPSKLTDLTDPKWKGKVGIAKPLFGTTATHAAVLFSEWGEERAKEFFRDLKENALILSGNRQVALEVGRNQLAFGLTDTDDAITEIDNGNPVSIIYPDQGEGEMGALFIPNTLALIKGSGHNPQAKKLIDYLLTAEVEVALAEGKSAQIPLNNSVKVKPRVLPDYEVRWANVDFEKAAEHWDDAAKFLRDEIVTP
ncbi:MAG: iron(III) transport system substrate-binding protein [Pirellulaceae bacterium]|jgi:iron(III) transport system substrate-binding protein